MGPGKKHFQRKRWAQGEDGVKERMWAREKTFFEEKMCPQRDEVREKMFFNKKVAPWRGWG